MAAYTDEVVDWTPALIHTARADGSVDYLNKGWLDFVGLPLDALLGWGWARSFHPDDIDGCMAKWRAALVNGEPFEAEGRVRRADGEYRTLLHRKVPARDEHGRIVKWYGSSMDVEERKRAEAALRRSEEFRLEERVNERTRIARELHDTLLQSFQGLVLRFETAASLLPDDPAQAKTLLEAALRQADQALAEGREAVLGLRSARPAPDTDLAGALIALGEDFVVDGRRSGAPHVDFHVGIDGHPQPLAAAVRDELYQIAREALRNAFQHARAARIHVDIIYRDTLLQMRIHDDGIGVDPSMLSGAVPSGHWGLLGMRERAARIGATIGWRSRPGTTIDVGLAADLAYDIPTSSPFRGVQP